MAYVYQKIGNVDATTGESTGFSLNSFEGIFDKWNDLIKKAEQNLSDLMADPKPEDAAWSLEYEKWTSIAELGYKWLGTGYADKKSLQDTLYRSLSG